jgi:hypothetical protein
MVYLEALHVTVLVPEGVDFGTERPQWPREHQLIFICCVSLVLLALED